MVVKGPALALSLLLFALQLYVLDAEASAGALRGFLADRPPAEGTAVAEHAGPVGRIARKAYVITVNTKTGRFKQTAAMLRNIGLDPVPVHAVSLADSAVKALAGTFPRGVDIKHLSNLATNRKILEEIARNEHTGEDEFSLVFEDDVQMSDAVKAAAVLPMLKATAGVANQTGFFYGGLCAATCFGIKHGVLNKEVTCGADAERKPAQTQPPTVVSGITLERAAGRCTHAIGVSKRRAKSLWADLKHQWTATAPICDVPGGDAPGCVPHSEFFDVMLEAFFGNSDQHGAGWTANKGAYLVGSDKWLEYSADLRGSDQSGLFYQDNAQWGEHHEKDCDREKDEATDGTEFESCFAEMISTVADEGGVQLHHVKSSVGISSLHSIAKEWGH
jgi:hypothetical protein